MSLPKGLILILHSGMIEIPIEECIEALPNEWQGLNREVKNIRYSEVFDLTKLYNLNFNQFALEHRRQFDAEILPLINRYPDYKIVYFGFAPIPLTVDLGQLFHNFRDMDIYQKHHKTKKWYLNLPEDQFKTNEISIKGLPEKDQKGIISALVRLSISHFVKPEDTQELLPNAAEIDVELQDPDEDAIYSKAMMEEVGEAFKAVLDQLAENRSSIRIVHLFASIPCGVAFIIGTKISPNIHPYIQTYGYSNLKDPKNIKAILVKGEISIGRVISTEEKKIAKEQRTIANTELTESISTYLGINENMSANRAWFHGIIPKLNISIMNEEFWTDLPALYETSLKTDTFDFDSEIINDGFYWRDGKWYVDDNFFISINKRLKDQDKIRKAIRLFLFHEALHYKRHKLTELTSVNIGSFPKVLEIADYQADVYGIMNEYGYCLNTKDESANQPKKFFLDAIKVATETMWSFDDNGINLEQIQVRRLNRYLIWYWQYARIEQSGNTLDEIIKILEEKPTIELNGLKTKEENNRFFYCLEKRRDQPLELAVFYKNTIIRDASASNMPIENLIKGISEMNSEPILNVMRSFVAR
jgi:hypothetical protein